LTIAFKHNECNGKHEQGTHSAKMGADKMFENTSNALKFCCPNCLSKPKILDFDEKNASLGVRSPSYYPIL
jgi:hypothetical protein